MILIWKFVSCLDNSRVYLGINATHAVNNGLITVNIYPVVLFARNLQCNGFSPVLIHIWSKSKYPDFPDPVWLWSSETATWKALSFNCLQNNYSIYLIVQRGLWRLFAFMLWKGSYVSIPIPLVCEDDQQRCSHSCSINLYIIVHMCYAELAAIALVPFQIYNYWSFYKAAIVPDST